MQNRFTANDEAFRKKTAGAHILVLALALAARFSHGMVIDLQRNRSASGQPERENSRKASRLVPLFIWLFGLGHDWKDMTRIRIDRCEK